MLYFRKTLAKFSHEDAKKRRRPHTKTQRHGDIKRKMEESPHYDIGKKEGRGREKRSSQDAKDAKRGRRKKRESTDYTD